MNARGKGRLDVVDKAYRRIDRFGSQKDMSFARYWEIQNVGLGLIVQFQRHKCSRYAVDTGRQGEVM